MKQTTLIAAFKAEDEIYKNRIVGCSSNLAVDHTSAATRPIGVAQGDCEIGRNVDVMLYGVAEIEAGDTIPLGALVGSGTGGRALQASSLDTAVGIALENAVVGDIVSVLLK